MDSPPVPVEEKSSEVPTVTISYLVSTGDTVTLQCEISISDLTHVEWKRETGGENITLTIDELKYSGSTPSLPSLVIKDVSTDDSGIYTCYITGKGGRGKSPPVTLKVNAGSDFDMEGNPVQQRVTNVLMPDNLSIPIQIDVKHANTVITGEGNTIVVKEDASKTEKDRIESIYNETKALHSNMLDRLDSVKGLKADVRKLCESTLQKGVVQIEKVNELKNIVKNIDENAGEVIGQFLSQFRKLQSGVVPGDETIKVLVPVDDNFRNTDPELQNNIRQEIIERFKIPEDQVNVTTEPEYVQIVLKIQGDITQDSTAWMVNMIKQALKNSADINTTFPDTAAKADSEMMDMKATECEGNKFKESSAEDTLLQPGANTDSGEVPETLSLEQDPSTDLDQYGDLKAYEWFVDNVIWDDVEDLLTYTKLRTFICWICKDRQRLYLSVNTEFEVSLEEVSRNGQNEYYLDENGTFQSIPQLIKHYMKNPVEKNNLLYPVKSLSSLTRNPECLLKLAEIGDFEWFKRVHDHFKGTAEEDSQFFIEDITDDEDNTILHKACQSGCSELCIYIYRIYPGLLCKKNKEGQHCLYHAAVSDNLLLFKHIEGLVLDGKTVEQKQNYMKCLKDIDDASVLHVACYEGSTDICHYLCNQYPCLKSLRDRFGNHCLHCAAGTNNIECYKTVETSVLEGEIMENKQLFLETLTNEQGQTVLQTAASYFNGFEIINYLCHTYPSLAPKYKMWH